MFFRRPASPSSSSAPSDEEPDDSVSEEEDDDSPFTFLDDEHFDEDFTSMLLWDEILGEETHRF